MNVIKKKKKHNRKRIKGSYFHELNRVPRNQFCQAGHHEHPALMLPPWGFSSQLHHLDALMLLLSCQCGFTGSRHSSHLWRQLAELTCPSCNQWEEHPKWHSFMRYWSFPLKILPGETSLGSTPATQHTTANTLGLRCGSLLKNRLQGRGWFWWDAPCVNIRKGIVE